MRSERNEARHPNEQCGETQYYRLAFLFPFAKRQNHQFGNSFRASSSRRVKGEEKEDKYFFNSISMAATFAFPPTAARNVMNQQINTLTRGNHLNFSTDHWNNPVCYPIYQAQNAFRSSFIVLMAVYILGYWALSLYPVSMAASGCVRVCAWRRSPQHLRFFRCCVAFLRIATARFPL